MKEELKEVKFIRSFAVAATEKSNVAVTLVKLKEINIKASV
jgi:hypothetical protein